MSTIKTLQALLERKEQLDDVERLSAARLLEDLRTDLVRNYTTGIITALPHEMAALEATFDTIEFMRMRHVAFKIASAAKRGSNSERIVAIIKQAVDYGNNMAAICATEMLTCFPHIDNLIMVGIAGGIPHPTNPDRHVRLGDVVVSNHEGITQYDFGKQEGEQFVERARGRPPSAKLLDCVNELRVRSSRGEAPWENLIDAVKERLNWDCPPEKTDVLFDCDNPEIIITHPVDNSRKPGRPKIIFGKIGSANAVLKSARHRVNIRDRFGVVAIEMEASGIADAAWRHESGYLFIRGICDYADERKNDDWQEYAAVTAAAYCRTLLEV